MAKDLLLEVGTEEMPANFMSSVRKDFLDKAKESFNKNRLEYKNCKVHSTPRRLVLYISDLAEIQQDEKEIVRGPGEDIAFDDTGNPTKAALGFAGGQDVEVDDLVTRDGYLYAEKIIKGKETSKILPSLVTKLLKKLSFPKSMRWGNQDLRFIRPVRWLVLLFGEEQLKFKLGGVESGKISYGHRFLSESEVVVNNAKNYFTLLNEECVIVDQNRRKEIILKQIEKLNVNGSVLLEAELLEEVVELIEYPTVFYGTFSDDFLELPEEVLITSMQEHQRYFPVVDDNNCLLPYFVGVRDGGIEHIDEVIKGNEMVIRARLADARFFFEEDRKISIEERQEKLKEIVYQEKLGSMYDKMQRVKNLAVKIANGLKMKTEKIDIIKRAAELCKNDLVTEMVNEFAKLQGIMGREYARLNGEKDEVAVAIFEHYQPRFAGDTLPHTDFGQVLSIADKMDNISGHFSVGMIPTGSQDPFALRRQAAGVVKIIIEKSLNIRLSDLINWSIDVFNDIKLFQEIKEFLLQRVINILEEKKIRYDIINAVMAVNNDDLNDLLARAEAVMNIRDDNPELFVNLIRGLVRAKNLATKADDSVKLNVDILETGVEKDLYLEFKKLEETILQNFNNRKYRTGLKQLVNLKEPVDNYLDNIVVMVDNREIRNNRLALLQKISDIVNPVMDINQITLD